MKFYHFQPSHFFILGVLQSVRGYKMTIRTCCNPNPSPTVSRHLCSRFSANGASYSRTSSKELAGSPKQGSSKFAIGDTLSFCMVSTSLAYHHYDRHEIFSLSLSLCVEPYPLKIIASECHIRLTTLTLSLPVQHLRPGVWVQSRTDMTSTTGHLSS